MNERISDKIAQIEQFLEELLTFVPNDLEEYLQDYKTRAACEHYAERIIEATVDLAFLIIKQRKFHPPAQEEGIFFTLAENNIIPLDLARRLKEAKGMRNILAHEYGRVDDRIVFVSIKEELEQDVQQFINIIRQTL